MDSNQLSRRGVLQLGVLGAGGSILAGSDSPARSSEPPVTHTQIGKDRLTDFVALSEELTGVRPLDFRLASEYMDRFLANPIVGPFLPELLDAYKSISLLDPAERPAALKLRVLESTAPLRPAAEQVVYLWYTSAFALRDNANPNKIIWQYGNEDQYNRALIWKLIHGHPPMTTPSEWVSAPQADLPLPPTKGPGANDGD